MRREQSKFWGCLNVAVILFPNFHGGSLLHSIFMLGYHSGVVCCLCLAVLFDPVLDLSHPTVFAEVTSFVVTGKGLCFCCMDDDVSLSLASRLGLRPLLRDSVSSLSFRC